MRPNKLHICASLIFTLLILLLGYAAFGFVTMLIFTSGFLGGFFLWLYFGNSGSYKTIVVPFWITFAMFIIHRVEEKQMEFFDSLSRITNVPTPGITSPEVIALVLLSVGAWIAVPFLVKRRSPFGHYLAWTFFAAMGITELAHFIFPFFVDGPYGYFRGMASVVLLAPAAWWGMYRLASRP